MIPDHLRPIARQIRDLSTEDFLHIADMTSRVAQRDVFSMLDYSGDAWYLPTMRNATDDEKQWEMYFKPDVGLIVTIAGKRCELNLFAYLIRTIILVCVWLVLWSILPQWLMQPGGYVFDPVIVVVLGTLIGGTISRILTIPALVGILWFAIMWNNIPSYHYLTSGIYQDVKVDASGVGLTMILLRAGLSANLKLMKGRWPWIIAMGTLPAAFENIAHSLISMKMWDQPNYTWGFLEGSICSIVSGAIVVPGILYLQSENRGTDNGPLQILLAAVTIDTCVGVWMVSFIQGVLFNQTGASLPVLIVLGPVQCVIGALGGIFLAFCVYYLTNVLIREAKKLPTGVYAEAHLDAVSFKAFLMVLFVCLVSLFESRRIFYPGGGAVLIVFHGATIANLWLRSPEPEIHDMKKRVGTHCANFWDLIVMPILFSMAGCKVQTSMIFNSTFFGNAIVPCLVGYIIRVIVAFMCTQGLGFQVKQRICAAGAWTGKSGLQSSLCDSTLLLVQAQIAANPHAAAGLAGAVVLATRIEFTALLTVMICAPLGSIILTVCGRRAFPKITSPVAAAH